MIKLKKIIYVVVVFSIIQSCSTYSFKGIQTGDAKTFQVNFFQNMANLIEPGIDQEFTNQLQNLVVNQTSLGLVTTQGDIIYEGEITEYRISPMTATADQRAAQNRLTISVNVRYINTLDGDNDFEKPFSFFFDYPADQPLVGEVKDSAIELIFERLTLDILNSSLGSW